MKVSPVTLVLMVIASGFIGGAAFSFVEQRGVPQDQPPAAGTSVTAVPLSQLTLSPLVDRVAPAVVNIAVMQPSPYEQNP